MNNRILARRLGKRILPAPANANANIEVGNSDGSYVQTVTYKQWLVIKKEQSEARMKMYEDESPMEQYLMDTWGIRLIREARGTSSARSWREVDEWLTKKYGKPL